MYAIRSYYELVSGIQIHVVIAGTAHGDDFGSIGGQFGQYRPTQIIVDEGADHRYLMRQTAGLGIQAHIEIVDVIPELLVGLLEIVTIIGFGAEQGDS